MQYWKVAKQISLVKHDLLVDLKTLSSKFATLYCLVNSRKRIQRAWCLSIVSNNDLKVFPWSCINLYHAIDTSNKFIFKKKLIGSTIF